MSDTTTVSVKILDKEYQVSCPREEVEALTASARHLDQQMRQIRETGKVFGLDRIAVMAALNIAHELLTTRLGGGFDLGEFKRRIGRMQEAIDRALAEQDELF
jgi:cell division protein ZapA